MSAKALVESASNPMSANDKKEVIFVFIKDPIYKFRTYKIHYVEDFCSGKFVKALKINDLR